MLGAGDPEAQIVLQDLESMDRFNPEIQRLQFYRVCLDAISSPSEKVWEEAMAAERLAIRKNPRSANLLRQFGRFYFDAYTSTQRERYIQKCYEMLLGAHKRKPNESLLLAELAWFAISSGKRKTQGISQEER